MDLFTVGLRTTSSTHVTLQIFWLNCEKDIWREISVSHPMFYILGVSSSYRLFCTNWGSVLIWLFVAYFSALVEDSLVSSLIIMKLFLWLGQYVIFTLTLKGFFKLNKVCLCFLNFYYVIYTLLVLLTCSYKFWIIYFRELLFYYRVCYCVGLFSHDIILHLFINYLFSKYLRQSIKSIYTSCEFDLLCNRNIN